ncbi:unnamed protein product, partial [Closterium sp. NIES-53]
SGHAKGGAGPGEGGRQRTCSRSGTKYGLGRAGSPVPTGTAPGPPVAAPVPAAPPGPTAPTPIGPAAPVPPVAPALPPAGPTPAPTPPGTPAPAAPEAPVAQVGKPRSVMVKRKKIALEYIPTSEQPADFLTKALHFPAFKWCSVEVGQVRLAEISDDDDDVQQ